MKLVVLSLLVAGVCASAATNVGYNQHGDRETTTTMQHDGNDGNAMDTTEDDSSCSTALPGTVWDGMMIDVHRNGEPKPCSASSISSSSTDMLAKLALFVDHRDNCPEDTMDKFQVESFLTEYFASQVETEQCASTDEEDVDRATSEEGLLSFCDMGEARTVVQNDHQNLIRLPSSNSLPCRWYTREGWRITSLKQLTDLAIQAREHHGGEDSMQECTIDESGEETCATTTATAATTLHLYAVPAGRMFMYAPSYVGETFDIQHVRDTEGNAITLEVLSVDPRVFDLHNFFNKDESDSLMEKAIQETSETHGFHRSTTGTSGASVFKKRTSENAWDTHGKTARIVKRRCFNLLGIDDYDESLADGLQILRYNMTTAYTPHMDYLENPATESYDYDSSGKGGNRFATILLYFTDLGERDGGETVFTRVWPPDVAEEDRVSIKDAIEQLRASGDADMLKQGSWEEEMTAMCRSKLAVRPSAARAVLFYSQFPNGKQDPNSFHGGCPVLRGTKLAANLWTWSGIRPEYDGAPRKFDEAPRSQPEQIKAVFKNTGKDPRFETAELYYDEDGYFGKLGFGDEPIYVNTFESHRWNVKVNGKTLQTFVIDDSLSQSFEV